MVQSDLDVILEMGFDKERAELAVKASGGLQGALQWLEDNQDKPIDEIRAEAAQAAAASSSANAEEGESANSLVCNECGKFFKNADLASFHATKSGHTDFAESTEKIKPLTEEQKKAKLEELREKLKAKRELEAATDAVEKKKNEKIRMKATQESQDAKEKLQRDEQIREAAKKRKEKLADIEARNRVRAKIEADKEARRIKAEQAKAAREGTTVPVAAAPAPAPAPAAAPRAPSNEARLRLQTSSGNIMKTLPAETTLFELAELIKSEAGISVTSFSTTFPRKTFEGSVDFGMTLKEAGFVPNASVVVK
ncbi:hypothetical protein TD95_001051 [Thielaviopsis punctulata]|uniref:C2H2-type domain-containing protein n=1 Tax=Thielaviopsis punctulata TaxID=72032 RepID=A0A0F4Z8X9_9PEZI|nr:hypothetical protein TD95_001051 [Thielaviopsis punctulata]